MELTINVGTVVFPYGSSLTRSVGELTASTGSRRGGGLFVFCGVGLGLVSTALWFGVFVDA